MQAGVGGSTNIVMIPQLEQVRWQGGLQWLLYNDFLILTTEQSTPVNFLHIYL